MKKSTIACLFCVLLLASWPVLAEVDAANRAITHVTGDLYQVEDDNNTFTAFLVTHEGIILTDPINTRTAQWLKAELDERFNLPVRYLIYSHSHDDHSSGAAVYDEAIIIGHENVIGEFEIWNDPSIAIDDFDGFDGDVEKLTAYRKANPAVFPDIVFNERMTIELGGKKVELIYLGRGHSDNMIAVHYPQERAVLAVDAVWIDRVSFLDLPYVHYFPELFEGLRIIENIDFEILLAGHGVPGKDGTAIGAKENITEFREYFEALYAKILEAHEQGLSKEEAIARIELPEFQHLGMYDKWFKLNVSGMWRHMYGE
jgi:glyoxylase-like metal-dependent hydrolase (beta-lactamase superfamily II)